MYGILRDYVAGPYGKVGKPVVTPRRRSSILGSNILK